MPGAIKSSKNTVRTASGRKQTTGQKAPRPKSGAAKAGLAKDPRPPRRLRAPRYKTLRLTKRIKHPVKLPSTWRLTKSALQLIFRNWKLVLGVLVVYEILNMLLVRGLSGGTDVSQLKSALDSLFSGVVGHITSGLTIFALLVGTSTSNSGANGATAYQSLLILMVSLALVWAYRQLLAGKKIRIRDAYYQGMYPMVPVILVLLVVSIQFIPGLIGAWTYGIVTQNGIATGTLQQVLWGIFFFLLVLLSLYMICSSIFALYIATLAEMTPMRALRSARELVRFRRWTVLRKVLFLPLWLLVIGALIMLPIILLVPVAAQWIFFVLTMIGLAFGHAYMYTLYRELLREKA